MDRLEDLVLFAEVVEHASFSAAARHLGLQRSKLSRRILELEKKMEIRLLQRNTRQMMLTTAGEQVYIHAKMIRSAANNAFGVATALSTEPKGTLRIGCSSTLAQFALMPILNAFTKQYPQIRIMINASDYQADLISEKTDLCFRVSSRPLEDSSLILRPIGEMSMIAVADKGYLQGFSQLNHPDELLRHRLIALSTREDQVTVNFLSIHKVDAHISFIPDLSCGNMSVLKSAVLAGMGIAVLPRYLCEAELRDGQLMNVFSPESGWSPAPSMLNALLPSRQNISLVTRLFLDFANPLLQHTLSNSLK